MTAIHHATSAAEDIARHALFSTIVAFSNREADPDLTLLRGRPHRVLFILEDAIGDTILAMPAIRALAASHPRTVVDVATWDGPAELLRHARFVRDVIVFRRHDRRRFDAATRLRRDGARYDVVVDGMVAHTHIRSRSLAMMIASGARHWVGELGRGNEYLLNVPRPVPAPDTPRIERMLNLVEPFLSCPPILRPELSVTDAERRVAEHTWELRSGDPRVIINVSTNGPTRQWPVERFAAVARYIRRHCPASTIIVLGLPCDADRMRRVADEGRGLVNAAQLREALALVSVCDLVVSPDTSICHMASAFERPLVSIHTPGFPGFLPFDTPGEAVIGSSPLTMESVSLRAVLRAVERTLARGELPAAVA